MIDLAVLDALVASGCTAEQIASAVRAACASAEKIKDERRERDKLRKRAGRAADKASCPAVSEMSDGQHGNPRTDADTTDNVETVSLSPIPLLSPTPPNNPLTPKPIQKNNSRGTRLPDDWQLTGPDLAYALSKKLNEAETCALAERFKSWALSASGPNSVKRNWHQAWQGWVQRDGPKIIAARAGPSAKPLTEFQKGRQELKGILNDLGNFAAGSGQGSGEDTRLLPGNTGQRSQGLRSGTGSDVIDLPASSYRTSG